MSESPVGPAPTTGSQHGHEERDINVRAVGWFVVILAAVIATGLLITWGLLSRLDTQQARREETVREMIADRQLPPTPVPGPKLLPNPALEMQDLRQRTEQLLSTYGWVDEEQEIARIPIERAMEMMLERGFEVRPESPAAEGDGQSPLDTTPVLREAGPAQEHQHSPGGTEHQHEQGSPQQDVPDVGDVGEYPAPPQTETPPNQEGEGNLRDEEYRRPDYEQREQPRGGEQP